MTSKVEIYENPETGAYEVEGTGACAGLFDPETFEGDSAPVDAYSFAEEWRNEAFKNGFTVEIEWVNTSVPVWVD